MMEKSVKASSDAGKTGREKTQGKFTAFQMLCPKKMSSPPGDFTAEELEQIKIPNSYAVGEWINGILLMKWV
ncbi:unnamed protein product [Ranitomeya imitator]|uniref:Uncharacterized protein n=1 Tax=Ranitomeya imitator TaxID=111125 RepID=A0ABN9MET1_9NEOB|nr:unnamed protein product [Ranitomeya imitator]